MAPMLNILSTHPFQSKHLLGLFSSNNTTMGSVGIITTTTTSWLYENYGDILILIDFLPQKHIILVKIWFCSGHIKNKNACNEATKPLQNTATLENNIFGFAQYSTGRLI